MNQTFITGLLTVAGSMITYLVARKKNDAELRKIEAETDNTELEAVDKAVKIWRELAAELSRQLKEVKEEIESLRRENILLKADLKKLKRSIDNNTHQN